jgi:hypothetical protein
MNRLVVIAGTIATLMLVGPGVAASEPLDSASTATFVAASLRVTHAAVARVGRLKASVNVLIGHVDAACPHVVPNSLQNGTVAQQRVAGALIGEALGELTVAETQPLRDVQKSALDEIASLRWTSEALNRRIAAFVRGSRAVLALRPPDLCVEAETAAKSNFMITPRATMTFNRRFFAATRESGSPALGDLLLKMKAFASSDTRAAVQRLGRLENQLGRRFSAFALSAPGRMVGAFIGG